MPDRGRGRGDSREGGGRRSDSSRDRRGGGVPRKRAQPRQEREVPFEPIVEVDFYPEEEPFKVLTKAIRNSYRTYELFEIARLILDKAERFVCVARDPRQKAGEEALLLASVPDGLPFQTEEAALEHVFRWHMLEFFDTEEVEVEAPTGKFPMVHKCGVTGEIIGPPNYHRYQALLKEHHATKAPRMRLEKLVERLESSREEEDIEKWMESMKRQTRYHVKGGETVLETPEDARLYLLTHCKDKLVRPAYSARFSGKMVQRLPEGDPIRRSVESHLEYQRKFPLQTANHLRGRLRRMKFAVYKRGSKGVSYVCAVKRRFRKPDEVLSDNLQELIDFIEAHPNFPAKDLPKNFLGIRESESAPAPSAAESTGEGTAESGERKAAEGEAEAAGVQEEGSPDAASKEGENEVVESEATEAAKPAPMDGEGEAETPDGEGKDEEPAEAERPEAIGGAEAESVVTAESSDAAEAKTSAAADAADSGPSDAERESLRQLRNDLRYLVSEGYVIEYSDGRLFVPPVRQDEINRQQKDKEAKEEKAESGRPAAGPVGETEQEGAETEEKAEEPVAAAVEAQEGEPVLADPEEVESRAAVHAEEAGAPEAAASPEETVPESPEETVSESPEEGVREASGEEKPEEEVPLESEAPLESEGSEESGEPRRE